MNSRIEIIIFKLLISFSFNVLLFQAFPNDFDNKFFCSYRLYLDMFQYYLIPSHFAAYCWVWYFAALICLKKRCIYCKYRSFIIPLFLKNWDHYLLYQTVTASFYIDGTYFLLLS